MAVARDEMRDLLERTLAELNEDDRGGPVLRASGFRLRIELTDIDLTIDVAASASADRCLEWSFEGATSWEPAIELRMESAVANRFLQDRESLAIAIARGRVRCRCEPRALVSFLPSLRLISEPYRRLVASRYPHLGLGAPSG